MFKKTKAFSSFSVDNMAEAEIFYSQLLGVEVEKVPMEGMFLLTLKLAGSVEILMYPKENH